MATFSYNASGTVKIGGCSGYSKSLCFPYSFGVGSIVYVLPQAQKGIIEKVAIKKVLLNGAPNYTIVYMDTFNSFYKESDLCDSLTAVATAQAYFNSQIASYANTLQTLCS